ncbi:Vegetative incompatibility protein HET-E-1 [Colletotrichum tropicale]|nr:Vegetative incompatibility protein HET-E-1 [Colletotrichum tropicale]
MQYNATERMQTEFYQSGAGPQQNNSGSGGQHNNSGCGPKYNATNINFGNRENDSFLADLRVTDPRDDKSRIQRTKGNLLKDSYRWILKHNDFCQWRAEKRLLWIKGGPGRGKTMLLCGVIDELVAMGYESTFFFFCEVTDARLNTATSVLRGLLYLIVDQHPIILNSLRAEYDRAGAVTKAFVTLF